VIRPADHQPTTHAQGVVSTLVELAEIDHRIIPLTADLGFIALQPFANRFPDRFLNVGVAEQSMMRTATGLANSDFIPFVYPIVLFAVLRPLEFIRNIGKTRNTR